MKCSISIGDASTLHSGDTRDTSCRRGTEVAVAIARHRREGTDPVHILADGTYGYPSGSTATSSKQVTESAFVHKPTPPAANVVSMPCTTRTPSR